MGWGMLFCFYWAVMIGLKKHVWFGLDVMGCLDWVVLSHDSVRMVGLVGLV